jgi:hypothetical protein
MSKTVARGADRFVEPKKETRPDFKELKSIEKERREILLRVSVLVYSIRYLSSFSI